MVMAASSAGNTLASGFEHSCELSQNGRAVCWGQNVYGQLGDGELRDRGLPLAVGSLRGAVALTAGGYHSCALLFGGGLRCWGSGESGRLGNGQTLAMAAPVAVLGFERSGAAAIFGGGQHTCALDYDGGVHCWGQNAFGQLGDGTFEDRASPVRLPGLSGVKSLATGGEHTCAVAGGVVWCWGRSFAGQVGDGATENRNAPVAVQGLPVGDAAKEVGAIGSATCARLESGDVYCWGNNTLGQVGAGSDALFHPSAVRVHLDRPAARVVGGDGDHFCALDRAGQALCWGSDDYGQLGDGAFGTRLARREPVPVSVTGDQRIVQLSLGGCHTCARKEDGATSCWGRNHHGQLGDGTTTDRAAPAPVATE
jgi:alpha-tubulin suppressor-like RCC1 family protein